MTWVARSSDLDSVIVNVDQNDPFDVARIMSCCICAVSCKCALLHLLVFFNDHELLKNQQHAVSLRHEAVRVVELFDSILSCIVKQTRAYAQLQRKQNLDLPIHFQLILIIICYRTFFY